ncbi:hypothetical protein [Luedemannella flava]
MSIATGRPLSDFGRRHYDDGVAQGEAQGEARGEALAVLKVLDARGIEISDAARAQIAECTAVDQIDLWLRRVATVASVEELLA